MQITRGKIGGALKVVLYGPEGIGKTSFASHFPNTVFIDTEGSTKFIDVARTPTPSSWTMLMEQVKYFRDHPMECGTLVIDTADWAEQMCIEKVCADGQKAGIEDFGYGKGYIYLMENFGKLLNVLEEIVCNGTYVVLTAHAKMRKFEQPDELGAYDRWEMKLQKTVAPMVKEWCDMLLFANYKTYVVNVDGQGAEKGKNKVQGGKRVMYTTHNNCWDAKNRHGLKEELPFAYKEIAHLIQTTPTVQHAITSKPLGCPVNMPDVATKQPASAPAPTPPPISPPVAPLHEETHEKIPQALADLMHEANVLPDEIQKAVAKRGYYPVNTPIANYDPAFVSSILVGAWQQVLETIESDPNRLPF